MIQYSQIATASFDVRRKAKTCRASERGNKVYVAPLDESKDRRIVLFLTEGVLCFSTDGVACEANWHGRYCCYHVFAANRRREINAKLRRTLASKRLQAA
jgi:hypothetical protein